MEALLLMFVVALVGSSTLAVLGASGVPTARHFHRGSASISLAADASALDGHNWTEPPRQFVSTIFRYQGTPPLATWEATPFASVNATVYDSSGDTYIILDGTGAIWWTDRRAGATAERSDRPSLAFYGGLVLPALAGVDQVCKLVAVPAGSCGNASAASPFCSRASSRVAIACTTALVLFELLGEGAAGSLNVVADLAIDPPPSMSDLPILAAADILFRGDTIAVLYATEQALLVAQTATSDAAPVVLTLAAVVLVNTNGTATASANATNVHCLTRAAKAAGGGASSFFRSDCVVVTSEAYCGANICPADLVHFVEGTAAAARHTVRIPGVVDARPAGIAFDTMRRRLHLGNDVALSLLAGDGSLHRIGGIEGGLPMNHTTCAGVSAVNESGADVDVSTYVWFGTRYGVTLWRPDGTWKYFFGPRWLPGRSAAIADADMRVIALSAAAVGAQRSVPEALMVTAGGVSVIRLVDWSGTPSSVAVEAWDRKARHYQDMVDSRNRYYFGLVADAPLTQWGNASSATPSDSCNHGLWTSMYLMGETFAFAATNDTDRFRSALSALVGMQTLLNVTGTPGTMARSLAPAAKGKGRHNWHASPTMPGWYFEGNPSSDEMTGHMHAYSIAADLLGSADPAARDTMVRLVDDIMTALVAHNLTLYDVTGLPTQWGRWNPVDLNDDPFWYDERGVNSMQILSFLTTAYRLTGKKAFQDTFFNLVNEHGYHWNMVDLKITQPSDIDYSDDELIFLAYAGYYWNLCSVAAGDVPASLEGSMRAMIDAVLPQLDASLRRTVGLVRPWNPSLWIAIDLLARHCRSKYAAGSTSPHVPVITASHDGMSDALKTLAEWPVSLVDWPTDNGHRLDVRFSPHRDRHDHFMTLLEEALPYDEITTLTWSDNPHDVRQGSGWNAKSPAMWLYPYWLLRYVTSPE